MSNDTINLRIDSSTKRAAQAVAEELGFSLSSLVKGYLKNLIHTRKVEFGLPEEEREPSQFLIDAIKSAEEDWKHGRTLSFKTPQEEFDYLDKLIADGKKSGKH